MTKSRFASVVQDLIALILILAVAIMGNAAVKAVENQTWDVSVKSLVAFPQILQPMNEKLDWTQKLGDAFLAD